MIKALNTASQGLLQAERRATDIAKDILKTTGNGPSFNIEKAEPSSAIATPTTGELSGTVSSVAGGPGFGNLIQQFADLRAEENAFKASATAFKKIDEALGTLLDDES